MIRLGAIYIQRSNLSGFTLSVMDILLLHSLQKRVSTVRPVEQIIYSIDSSESIDVNAPDLTRLGRLMT